MSHDRAAEPKTPPSHEGGIVSYLRRSLESRASLTALVGRRGCRFDSLSYEELWANVDRMAAGLLELGIESGNHVGLIAENSDLWLIASLALQAIGAVDVPRGGDAPEAEVRFCLEHARCTAAIVEDARQLEKLGPLRDSLGPVVVLTGNAPAGCAELDSVLLAGERALDKDPEKVTRQTSAIDETTLSTIIYTSGTTGNPKGVMLTHGNLLHNLRAVPLVIELHPGDRFLSFLPSWHSFERMIEYVILDSGCELHYSNKRSLKSDLLRVRPQFLVAVPRVYEIFARNALDAVMRKKGIAGALIRGALAGSRVGAAARRLSRRLEVDRNGRLPRLPFIHRAGLELIALLCAPAHALVDRVLYRKIRQAFGGRVHSAISGGGPLPAHVDEFLLRAGLPLRNGYGLTETSPIVSVRPLDCNRLGTVGVPVSETEVRIVDEEGRPVEIGESGVIEIRGPQVMRGYFDNEKATRFALREDGWFHSGDRGSLTEDGDIVITGRAKDTIVLSGGENIEPEGIEAVLLSSPLIVEALIVGHGQKTLGALVFPDLEGAAAQMELEGGTTPALDDPAVLALLRDEVARCVSPARGFRSYERVGRLQLLAAPFSVEEGTLTETLKKKRSIIEERHQAQIFALFEDHLTPG